MVENHNHEVSVGKLRDYKLGSIDFTFSNKTEEQRRAFGALKSILDRADVCGWDNEGIRLTTTPKNRPHTFFCIDALNDTSLTLKCLGGYPVSLADDLFPKNRFSGSTITFDQLHEGLGGHVMRVDHTGIVVPRDLNDETWRQTVEKLAAGAAMFEYPDLPEYDHDKSTWLFVIPQTTDELAGRTAVDFSKLRQPKFELVREADGPECAILQIDVQTNLSREQILQRFPDKQSFDLPGLGDFFRSVNVQSPWEGIGCIRMDMRPKNAQDVNDWNSGKWLMENGRRIKSACTPV